MAPIERGFSNVLKEVRLHEDQAMINPVKVINEAFYKYSILGEMSHVARSHFSCYHRNHEDWLHNIEQNVLKQYT